MKTIRGNTEMEAAQTSYAPAHDVTAPRLPSAPEGVRG